MNTIIHWLGELMFPTPGSVLQRLFSLTIAFGAVEILTDPVGGEHFWAFVLALFLAENPFYARAPAAAPGASSPPERGPLDP